MSFAREGTVFIASAMLAAAAVFALAVIRRSWPLWLLAFLLAVVSLWIAYFFRDPERSGPRGSNLVISPADGRVVGISEVEEPEFLGAKARRISIFMNVFDVHVNRYPVSGTVRYVHYNPGKFLHAAGDKASLDNEQLSVGISFDDTRILVRQIAGLIARRIVNYSRTGAFVQQGARMGIIRFGSRVDVFVPLSAEVLVEMGQRVLAGSTVLARLAIP